MGREGREITKLRCVIVAGSGFDVSFMRDATRRYGLILSVCHRFDVFDASFTGGQ